MSFNDYVVVLLDLISKTGITLFLLSLSAACKASNLYSAIFFSFLPFKCFGFCFLNLSLIFFILLIIIWKFYACICIILHLPFLLQHGACPHATSPLLLLLELLLLHTLTHTKHNFVFASWIPKFVFIRIIFCYFFVRYLFCLQIVHKILKLIFTSDLFIWVCVDKQFLYYSFIPLVCSVIIMALNVVLQKRKLIFLFFITTKSAFLNYKNNIY